MPSKTIWLFEPGDREHQPGLLAPEEHRPCQVVPFHQVPDPTFEAHTALLEKTARSAIAAATFSDCSTMISVIPGGLQAVDHLDQLLDDDRGEPEGELVDHEDGRVVQHGDGQREHLLLAARQRVGSLAPAVLQDGEELVDPLGPPTQLGLVGAVDEAAHFEVLRHRHRAEDALPALQEMDAEPRALLGRGVGDVPTVESHDAARRDLQAGGDVERRRLPGAVGPEQRQDLAFFTSKLTPKRIWTWP